tara:strand:+ start:1897 stop:2979 length:1083 start_codon:yes stop_codon:yes gene_type:complete
MGEIVNRTRNIFLDSEQYHSGGDLVRMFLPNDAFSLHKDESMKFIVSSFEMQKKFYNINKHNNTFYAVVTSIFGRIYTEIKIKEGDYFQFGENADVSNSLCQAIYNALDDAVIKPIISKSSAVTYNVTTRKLAIDMSGVANSKWNSSATFVSFQIPNQRQPNPLPTGVSDLGIFNDSYEILGAKPTKRSNIVIPAFQEDASKVFTSFYPASLYTIESIHLRTSLQSNNYQSPSLNADSQASRLIPTEILARFPIDMGKMFENIKQDIPSIIKFEDTGAELYSMALQQKQIDTFNFRLTDAKGREIAEVSADQYLNGALSYKMVLKWEAIHSPEVGQPAGFLSRDHQLEAKQENTYIRNAF